MLSRTADAVYWMSRQMERAENQARLLDVLYQMSLLPGGVDQQTLASPLLVSGTEEIFHQHHPILNMELLIRFCTLNRNNPASLYNNLRQARDNARIVRGDITSEMWESINTTWLQLQNKSHDNQSAQGYRRFLDWIKERSHLFRGVTFGTIRRNQAFAFSRLGTFIERADNTLRILLIHAMAPQKNTHSWEILLHSLSAQESYRAIYQDASSSIACSELLILDVTFPRSLHASLQEIQQSLDLLPLSNGLECRRITAELLANLRYSRIEHVLEHGLESALIHYLETITELGDHIQNAYLEFRT